MRSFFGKDWGALIANGCGFWDADEDKLDKLGEL